MDVPVYGGQSKKKLNPCIRCILYTIDIFIYCDVEITLGSVLKSKCKHKRTLQYSAMNHAQIRNFYTARQKGRESKFRLHLAISHAISFKRSF